MRHKIPRASPLKKLTAEATLPKTITRPLASSPGYKVWRRPNCDDHKRRQQHTLMELPHTHPAQDLERLSASSNNKQDSCATKCRGYKVSRSIGSHFRERKRLSFLWAILLWKKTWDQCKKGGRGSQEKQGFRYFTWLGTTANGTKESK